MPRLGQAARISVTRGDLGDQGGGGDGLGDHPVHARGGVVRLLLGQDVGGDGHHRGRGDGSVHGPGFDGWLPCRPCRASGYPSRRGRNCPLAAASTPCSPSSAHSTVTPSACKSFEITRRLVGLSSTNSTRNSPTSAGSLTALASSANSSPPISIQKVEPWPGWLVKPTAPPIISARRLVMARPRPEPPNWRDMEHVRLLEALEKGGLRFFRDAPTPVSCTSKRRRGPSAVSTPHQARLHRAGGGVNFTAFPMML